MALRPLPTGIADFEKIRLGGYLYVDKTRYVFDLVTVQGKDIPTTPYFLARPRRFGKSLTLSVIKALFEGRRDLFTDLWIYSNWNWEEWRYPVLYLDMSEVEVENAEQLKRELIKYFSERARAWRVDIDQENPATALRQLIEGVHHSTGRKVVIIVDEYDSPIVSNLDDLSEAEEIKRVLQGVYRQLKTTEPYQRFLLLTGISKFSRAGVFSALNNLVDLTFDSRAKALIGITEKELDVYFSDYVRRLAEKTGLALEEVRQEIKRWYNGFCFSLDGCDDTEKVYNPFSLLNLFDKGQFGYYWYASGNPKFLIDLLKKSRYPVEKLEEMVVDLWEIDHYDVDDLNILALLVQTGYLTISSREGSDRVKLAYPNYEVKNVFINTVSRLYLSDKTFKEASAILDDLVASLEGGDIDSFITRLNSVYELIEYDHHITIREKEQYYQTVSYLLLTLLGMKVGSEVKTREGRIDLVVETEGQIYLVEFKLGEDAEKAIDQMLRREYAEKFTHQGKPVYLIGVAVDPKKGKIVDWRVNTLNQRRMD